MRLLIITQKVDKNDSYFGFFHDWLVRFAKVCDEIIIIGLEVHEYDLPVNVKVFSLGKESRQSKILYIFNFYRYIIGNWSHYDSVFAHMSPWYAILGAPLWSISNKKVGLWYVHRMVDSKLKLAEKCSDVIFTATPESFRIATKKGKVHYMGQAVDLSRFKRPDDLLVQAHGEYRIVTVGRVTPIKNIDVLIHAVKILIERGINTRLDIIGEPVQPHDHEYKKILEEQIARDNLGAHVRFVGSIANKDLAPYFWNSDVSVNLCPTGGLDKTVLESMASGTPVVLTNQAFKDHLGNFSDHAFVRERDPQDCARALEWIRVTPEKNNFTAHLEKEVAARSSLDVLIENIVRVYKEITSEK